MIMKTYLRRMAALGAAACIFTAVNAEAADVTLRSNDGSIDIQGDLLEFTDGIYVVQTALGALRLSAARVRCEGAGCPVIEVEGADVRISGSETVGEELMPLILAGYASRFDAEADVRTGNNAFEKAVSLIGDGGFGDEIASFSIISQGSDSGFTDLRDAKSDLAMSSRVVRPDEVKEFAAAGFGDLSALKQERIVAVDSLRIIVSPENPIDTINAEDLAAIYAGEITNWSQVGGPNAPINVYSRSADTGTFEVINQRLLRPRRKAMTSAVNIVSGNIEMAKAVSSDPSGIGFVSFAFERGAKSLKLRTECGLVVEPDAFSAKTEEYPLERRLYLYARDGEMSEHAAGLFDYVASEDVDGLVAKAGFVDLSIKVRRQDQVANQLREQIDASADVYEQDLMRQLYIEMLDYDRLSTTFRFAPGSSVLDNKAQRDLDRVINYLSQRPNARVSVVGFTDADGAFSANLALAERRAAQVASEIERAAGDRLSRVDIDVKGFGELLPSACNETFDGRKINRRVEIWVSNRT